MSLDSMKRGLGWIAIAGLGAVFAVHVGGCSIIGLMVGTGIDANTPSLQRLRGCELVSVSPGTRVALLLDDSTRVRGTYQGSTEISDAEYLSIYDAWRTAYARGDSFPDVGEHVELKPGGKGIFVAFVAQGVEIKTGRLGTVSFDLERWLVRRDGSKLDLLEARDLALAGKLPMATELRIQSDEGERRVRVDRVIQVDVHHERHAALKGFIVGLAADVMFVATVREINSQPCGLYYPPAY